ncbi:MAG: hypothetical protein K8R46_09010, partial [Pirellulales bacterium]|nr:hypothetical protein [Pirellulales bacterium]
SEAYPWAGKRGNPTRVSSAYPWHPPFPQQKLIMTTCGFRLPNDPRGSWSDWMRHGNCTPLAPPRKWKRDDRSPSNPTIVKMRMEAKKAL